MNVQTTILKEHNDDKQKTIKEREKEFFDNSIEFKNKNKMSNFG